MQLNWISFAAIIVLLGVAAASNSTAADASTTIDASTTTSADAPTDPGSTSTVTPSTAAPTPDKPPAKPKGPFLTDIDDADDFPKFEHNPSTPFAHRWTSPATIWNIKKTSFAFHLEPREDCQEVWLCSTDVKEITDDLKGHLHDLWCADYTRFRPLEGSVTIGLNLNDPTVKGHTEVFPWTRVILRYNSATDKYKLKVASGDRDVAGKVPGLKMVEITLTDLPLIITSSPYCHPIVQDDSGNPVNSVMLGLQGHKHQEPFPQMRSADAVHKKTMNDLLVPTHLTSYAISSTVKCPPLWLSEFEHGEGNWATQSKATKQKATFMLYELEGAKNCPLSGEGRISFKVRIDSPRQCTWIRLCIMNEAEMKKGHICNEPKKSIELMIAYKMFVGIDSDQARSMDTESKNLELIRFQLDEVDGKKPRFTMSYGFASDEGAVQHHMYGEELKDMMAGGNYYVALVRDSECMARLVTDTLLEAPVTEGVQQCLTVTDCQVLVPKTFAPFSGSQSVNLDDYTQA